MDLTHHHHQTAAPKNPRRRSFTCSAHTCAVQHYPHHTMNQSQILTPPRTPPRSPRPSISTPTPTPPRNTAPKDRTTLQVHFDLHTSLHRNASSSTTASMSDSSLWALPGSSSTLDPEPTAAPASTENRWFRLLQGAASSNRARHRARFERDGWAFVGGRYSDELQDLTDESAASVDDEFDLVVLARESVGC